MAEQGRSSFLAIVLGVFAAVSFVGIVGMVLVSWVLNRSLEGLVDRIFADTGLWLVPEEATFEGEEVELGDYEYEEGGDEE